MTVAGTPASYAPVKSGIATISDVLVRSCHLDSAEQARDELERLRADPGARDAYYQKLRHTILQVRASNRDVALEDKPLSSCLPQ